MRPAARRIRRSTQADVASLRCQLLALAKGQGRFSIFDVLHIHGISQNSHIVIRISYILSLFTFRFSYLLFRFPQPIPGSSNNIRYLISGIKYLISFHDANPNPLRMRSKLRRIHALNGGDAIREITSLWSNQRIFKNIRSFCKITNKKVGGPITCALIIPQSTLIPVSG